MKLQITGATALACLSPLFAAVIQAPYATAVESSAASQEESRSKEESVRPDSSSSAAEIREQAREYEKAFAKGDARALAGMWAKNGTYTDASGREYSGRDQIEAMFTKFFRDVGPRPMVVNIESIKMIGEGSAIEKGTSSVKDSERLVSSAPYTVVHVKNNGKWEIAACTEFAPLPVSNSADTLKSLSWLIGDWSAKGTLGEATLSTRWGADQHCLISKFTIKTAAVDKHEDLQVIGFDPASQSISSWTFASEGGTARGSWIKDGDSWVVAQKATTSDGHVATALNVIEPKADGSFTWQSKQRSLDGISVPDSEKITVIKSKSTSD